MILVINIFTVFFPLALAHGLDNVDSEILIQNNHSWPQHWIKLLIGPSLLFIGEICSPIHGDFLNSLLYNSIYTPFWLGTNLFCQILIQNFIDKSSSTLEFPSSTTMKEILQSYQQLEKIFSNYFFLFYFNIQSCVIFYAYYLTSNHVSAEVQENVRIPQLIGDISIVCGIIMFLASLTESVNSAYKVIQDVKSRINVQMENTTNDEELKKLKFCRNEADMLRPMSAAGYFEIDKTTLTSMMSVRCCSLY